ncbi:hypothetical protein J6590_045688 [Homalodisca vitripennis]|nr:hypothetical protein J6590_013741 [Homalodisca vitripennis]KAG8306519.1 hypothetical protein J6590_045688 [Homalodisca vitripennis]
MREAIPGSKPSSETPLTPHPPWLKAQLRDSFSHPHPPAQKYSQQHLAFGCSRRPTKAEATKAEALPSVLCPLSADQQ